MENPRQPTFEELVNEINTLRVGFQQVRDKAKRALHHGELLRLNRRLPLGFKIVEPLESLRRPIPLTLTLQAHQTLRFQEMFQLQLNESQCTDIFALLGRNIMHGMSIGDLYEQVALVIHQHDDLLHELRQMIINAASASASASA